MMSHNASEPAHNAPAVTIIVTPRERFGVAIESLEAVVAQTEPPYKLIYVDGNSPPAIAAKLKDICESSGFTYLRFNHYLSPNKARNIGQRLADTELVAFVDNDVVPDRGWLRELVACARETEADVVAPLTCQKLPLHSEIHQAGGEFADDVRAFFARPEKERRITDIHVHQGKRIGEVVLTRGETQCCEFHCTLVRRDVFTRWGDLDERLLATKEHIDMCMTVWRNGGKVMFEPKSVVTYLFPSGARPLVREDWEFFLLRWSPVWQQRSLEHFQRKWSLFDDPYFKKRRKKLSWRHREGIARPIVRRLPIIGKYKICQKLGMIIIIPFLKAWAQRLDRGNEVGIVH